MQIGEIYSIRLGRHMDKYIVTSKIFSTVAELKRVQTPKSKIDGVRLPESMTIIFEGHVIPQKKIRKK